MLHVVCVCCKGETHSNSCVNIVSLLVWWLHQMAPKLCLFSRILLSTFQLTYQSKGQHTQETGVHTSQYEPDPKSVSCGTHWYYNTSLEKHVLYMYCTCMYMYNMGTLYTTCMVTQSTCWLPTMWQLGPNSPQNKIHGRKKNYTNNHYLLILFHTLLFIYLPAVLLQHCIGPCCTTKSCTLSRYVSLLHVHP